MLQFRYKSFFKPLGICLLITAIIWGVYNITLKGPFLWDDEVMVQQNAVILHPDDWTSLFTSSAFGESFDKEKFYRPIQILSYMMDVSIWGVDEHNQPIAQGFHITSITIHCINSLLFFALLLSLSISFIPAACISLIFAIHPIHIECVSYISGRGDLLFLTFGLLSTLCFIHGSRKRKILYIISGVLFIIGMLTKENIIALPVLLLILTGTFLPKEKQKASYITASILTLIAIGFSIWRLIPGSASDSSALSLIAVADLPHRFFTLPYIIVSYLRLLVWPHPLHMEYHYVAQQFITPYLIALPLIGIIFYLAYHFLPQKKQVVGGFLWFFVALAPVYNLLPKLPSTIREHWVVLPSIGLFWILAMAFEEGLNRFKKYNSGLAILLSLTALIVTGLGIATYHRNLDWIDPMRLYTHDVKHEPASFLLHNNIGVIAFREGNMKRAEEAFQTSIQVSPGKSYGTAYNNLGVILENKGQILEAQRHFEASIKFSAYELGYINLGRILLRKNEALNAISVLKNGKDKYPNNIQIRYYLGVGYFLSGQYVYAKQELEWVYRYAGNIMATENLLVAIQKAGF